MSINIKAGNSVISRKQAVSAYSRFLESLNTPVSLSVYMQLKYGCYDDLVNRKIYPRNYADVALFRKDYQACKGLSKAAFLPTKIDRRLAAESQFRKSESRCAELNERFDGLMYGGELEKLVTSDPTMFSMLSKAQNLIAKILGPLPTEISPRFGPGTTSFVKRNVTLPQKYSRVIHVTPELFSFFPDLVGPLWMNEVTEVTLVRGNSISFVEKNAKTDRAIAIEPHLNVYAQLGLGQILRDKLRRWINLDTGQEVNRFLASQAQEWRLTTVDIESASDSISRSLVWYLLPEQWATALDSCRSHMYSLNNEWHVSNKFSSMGNGFTFELETIIFYALARAAGSDLHLTACYGDDIIAEARVYPELVRVLEYCGFSVNLDKSFVHSNFYESCGEDYFEGLNVRPFFWKHTKDTSIFKMINDVSRWSERSDGKRDRKYFPAYAFLKSLLKGDLKQCLIPYGYGDVGIETSWDDAEPSVRRNANGWCGFTTKAVRFRPDKRQYGGDVRGYLSSLDSCKGASPSLTSESPIRGRGVYQVGRLKTFGQWSGPGPWVN